MWEQVPGMDLGLLPRELGDGEAALALRKCLVFLISSLAPVSGVSMEGIGTFHSRADSIFYSK